MKKTHDLLYKELSGKIIGAAIEVHKILGTGFLEAVYQEALEYELELRKIPFESQKELKIKYKDITLKLYKPRRKRRTRKINNLRDFRVLCG